MRVRAPSLSLGALFYASGAIAQESPPEPEIGEAAVLAPARREETLLDTPRAVSTDNTNSARRALARDVGERLDELPGVFVQRTTTASAAPLLRGLGGQRALLLFDGLRLNDSLTKVGGNALLNLIDPSVVDRVEVVRGPASVMYGSDALGGVVLVNPLDPVAHPEGDFRWRGELMLRGASAERSFVSSGMIEGELGPVGLLVGASGGTTGRLVAGGDLGVQPFTGHDDWAFSARGTVTARGGHRVGLAFHTSSILDAPRPDLSTDTDRRVFRLQRRDTGYAHYRYRSGDITVTARAGAVVRTEHRDRLRIDRADVERDQVLTWVGSAQLDLRRRDARFTVGAEATLDEVASATTTTRGAAVTTARGRYIDGSTYLQSGLFALWQQRVGPRFLFEAGARLAAVHAAAPVDGSTPEMSQLLLAPVGSVGARYLLTRGVALMANALTGFRAPNLDDFQALGSGARSFDVPNAALGAERSWSAELGARVVRDGWTGSLFVYGALLTGLVVRVPSSFNGMTVIDDRRVFTRQNASDGAMWGVEFDLGYRARNGLYAAVAGMYTQADNSFPDEMGNTVTEPMAKIPPAVARVSGGWRGDDGWVELSLQGALPQARLASSDREDLRLCPTGAMSCSQVDGWVSMSVRGGWNITRWATVGAAIENVWNGAFTPYGAGYPAAGVNVVGMIRLRAR